MIISKTVKKIRDVKFNLNAKKYIHLKIVIAN